MLHDKNLVEMSLRLNRSEPFFRTIRELPGIGRGPPSDKRRRTTRKKSTNRFHDCTTKTRSNFIFRILPAVKLNFHLLTSNFEETASITFHGA